MTVHRRSLLVGGLATGLTGCTEPAMPTGGVPLAPGVTLGLPTPASLGRQIEASQLVQATYQGRDIVFEGALSITADRVLLVCMDMLGRQALMAKWTGADFETTIAPWFPTSLRPDNMLADIMLIYWPAEPLRRTLRGAVLDESTGSRSIRDGRKTLIQIEYDSPDSWNGTARYESVVWSYSLRVQSAEARA